MAFQIFLKYRLIFSGIRSTERLSSVSKCHWVGTMESEVSEGDRFIIYKKTYRAIKKMQEGELLSKFREGVSFVVYNWAEITFAISAGAIQWARG